MTMIAPIRMWGGRFGERTAETLERLNRSLDVDRRLWREDIQGSRAWARALVGAGVVTAAEGDALIEGLAAVEAWLGSWSDEAWSAAPDEDIHSLVERLLHEEVGPLAGKLHTGRSRNDQVATDARLWARGAVARLDRAIGGLQLALVEQAERHVDTLMPAHTHLQPAQPISVGHWLLSHGWALERDRSRLKDAAHRASVLVLGSGAVAGCPFAIDREALAEELGFDRVSENSLDAVADRDWAAELLFAISLTGVHLSRLAEDLVIFASEPFGFVRLGDAWSTGSSLMPQKRNPDGLELARGKAGALLGDLVSLLATLKGTPSGYNKDLQDDKLMLFRAFDTLEAVLAATTGTLHDLEVVAHRCARAIHPPLMATDLADLLVDHGVPFREAHDAVGRMLVAAERSSRPLAVFARDEWEDLAPGLTTRELERALDPAESVARRGLPGGTAPDRVRDQARLLRARANASR